MQERRKQQVMDKKQSRATAVTGVEKSAIELAKQNDYSIEKASIAALVHDYSNERTAEEFKKIILDENLSKDLLNWNNFIWHGVVGAEIIKNELQIKISDNGIGFDYESKKKKSFGLTNIQNRVQEINGNLEVESNQTKGTNYSIKVKL